MTSRWISILLPWRWRRVLSERCWTFTRVYAVISDDSNLHEQRRENFNYHRISVSGKWDIRGSLIRESGCCWLQWIYVLALEMRLESLWKLRPITAQDKGVPNHSTAHHLLYLDATNHLTILPPRYNELSIAGRSGAWRLRSRNIHGNAIPVTGRGGP
jgi:hypothetical protein